MATTDSEHYVRLTLLTQQGGILISKQILLREVDALPNKPGLVVFLKGHKTHFELKKRHHDITSKQYKILFPSGGYDTDIEEWDLQLLIKVILDLFNLTGRQTSDLQEILRIRNEIICHAKQPAISDQDFLSNWTKIVGCMNRLSVSLDSAIAEQASTLIDNFGTGPLCLQTSLDKLSALCRNDEHMEHVLEFLARIDRGQKFIVSRLASQDVKLEEIYEAVRQIQQSMPPTEACKLDIPTLQFQLTITGGNKDDQEVFEEFILRAFQAAKDKADDVTDGKSVMRALMELIQEMERNGGKFDSAEKGSILIKVKCNTLSSLQQLLIWLTQKEYNMCLRNLESALEKEFQTKVNVGLSMSEDAILKISDWSEELPCETKVNIGVKCQSIEAVPRVVEYLTQGGATNKLNRLSETLSDAAGDRIIVHATLDTEKLLTDLRKVEIDLSTRKMSPRMISQNKISELQTAALTDENDDVISSTNQSPPKLEGDMVKMQREANGDSGISLRDSRGSRDSRDSRTLSSSDQLVTSPTDDDEHAQSVCSRQVRGYTYSTGPY